jgi:hypothetical protein
MSEPGQRIPGWVWFGLILLLALIAYGYQSGKQESYASVGILVPDGMPDSEPKLAIWLDAAKEEGLLAQTVHLSNLASEGIRGKDSGHRVLILPDQILKESNPALLKPLQEYVQRGGHLLISFDAFTKSLPDDGNKAMLSNLVGIDYGLYGTMGDEAIKNSAVLGSEKAMTLLGIPPGKAMPYQSGAQLALTTYGYGFLTYPHFVTRGTYTGHALLSSPTGSLILGERQVGKGLVMFSNLPMGYLKGHTDGLLLHATLRRIADLAGVPSLTAAPDGIGGLIFNMHVDANTSRPAFEEMDRRGLFSQGPFSIHFTTGPDAHKKGDRAGMDLEHNPAMQKWIKRFVARGDAIGDHGGWLHDYFGRNVENPDDRAEMISFLKRNDEVLSKVIGEPIREYSAPLGAQPEWVTEWIEKRGVLAYYFTGNTGMSPTRSYRNGVLNARKIWSFPILSYGKVASIEEADKDDVSHQEMTKWLKAISDFAADTGTVRTFYSHPPDFFSYFDSIQQWFDRTRELAAQGRFRWYTMEGIATFLNRRELVRWSEHDTGKLAHFTATQPSSLQDMTWHLPKLSFSRPVIGSGNAKIRELPDAWEVVAGSGNTLTFDSALNSQ